MRRFLRSVPLAAILFPVFAWAGPRENGPVHPGFPWPGAGLIVFAILMLGLLAILVLRLAGRLSRLSPRLLDVVFAGGLTLAAAAVAFDRLGTGEAPRTYYQGGRAGDAFLLDLGAPVPVAEARYFLALGAGAYDVDFSRDGRTWQGSVTVEQEHAYSMIVWRTFRPGLNARYARVTTVKPGAMFGELALFGPGADRPLPVRAVLPAPLPDAPPDAPPPGDPRLACDEPERVPAEPSYLNGMYFDECYHARAAYEYALGRDSSETTHPPLGKLAISLGVLAFGFTPFGWRVTGALSGVLMVPLLYALALALFKKREWAFGAAFLFACDFMRFTQTRIATIDVYGVFWIILMFFFMLRALKSGPLAARPRRFFRNLLLSGLCLGIGAASKWIVLYAAVGLAAVFVGGYAVSLARHVRRTVAKALSPDDDDDINAGTEGGPARAIALAAPPIIRRTLAVFAFSLLAFFVIPAGIYLASYIPFMAARGPAHPETPPLQLVINEQKFMYDYHADLEATHDFSSPWPEWPVMARPMWYYTGRASLPPETASNIYAFGNPAVWWTGSLAAVVLILAILAAGSLAAALLGVRLLAKGPPERKDAARARFIAAGKRLLRLLDPGIFILIALAAQYLPWIVVPRTLTFIYHFFASVPFIVLCLVLCLKLLAGRWRGLRWALPALLGTALALFIMFYPLLSGALVSTDFANACLRWFPGWFPYL